MKRTIARDAEVPLSVRRVKEFTCAEGETSRAASSSVEMKSTIAMDEKRLVHKHCDKSP